MKRPAARSIVILQWACCSASGSRVSDKLRAYCGHVCIMPWLTGMEPAAGSQVPRSEDMYLHSFNSDVV